MYFWTIRINRLVIQFETEALMTAWRRPEGLPGTMYMFLAPRNPKHDFVTA